MAYYVPEQRGEEELSTLHEQMNVSGACREKTYRGMRPEKGAMRTQSQQKATQGQSWASVGYSESFTF